MSLDTQLKKGVLELCILAIIGKEPIYGYDLIEQLKSSGLVVTEGTLYPILSRLRQEGMVETTIKESATGPSRRYYELSEKGKLAVVSGKTELLKFFTTVKKILN